MLRPSSSIICDLNYGYARGVRDTLNWILIGDKTVLSLLIPPVLKGKSK